MNPQTQFTNNTSNTPEINKLKPTDCSDFLWVEEEDGVRIIEYNGSEEAVVIPEFIQGKPVRVIGFHAFWCNYDVRSMVLPQNLRMIAQSAFNSCENLEKLEIPYGTEIIGISSFRSCRRLKTLILPSSVKEIGVHAFCNCTNLREVAIPDSVQRISKDAFAGCANIKEVAISLQTRKRLDPWGKKIPNGR